MAPNVNRRTVLAAAAALALAAGAFVAIRPDGGSPSGRDRHRQFAGSTETTGVTTSQDPGAPGGSTVPDGAGGTTPTGKAPATAPGRAGGPGASTSATSGGGDGSPASTNSSGERPAPSQPGSVTTPTSGPPATTRRNAPVTATAAPGWAVLPKAPIGPRTGHTAVWTGKEMVIWGGTADFENDAVDGAAYDPATRTWRKVPAAPFAPRYGAQAFWTGQEMLIFGGSADDEIVVDGAAWNPVSNTWRPIPAAPTGSRDGAVIAWAGDRLVLWSGNTVAPADSTDDFVPEVRNDGAAYVPATNTWVPVGAAPIPPRSGAQSVWTGSRLIVSGGDADDNGEERRDGAAYDPVSGAWSPIAARPEPGACGGDTACGGIWTGSSALFPASGFAYNPAANTWSGMAAPPVGTAPAAGEPAVWTGRRLLAWGVPNQPEEDGADPVDAAAGPATNAGALYDPAANRWEPIPAGPLSGRSFHTAVWAGDTLLIWGGVGDDAPEGDGAAYRPE